MQSMAMLTRFADFENATHASLYKKVNKKDRPLCTHCGMLGHVADKYYKLHGYLPGY